MKRCIDLLLAVFFLAILSPLFIILSIMVYVKLGYPIVFKQLRPGFMEKPFYLYKFRSMTDLKDEKGNFLPDEKRLTPFGNWIRKYSLDELPQLINVIKGDLSLVGPRPLLMEYLPLYNSEQAKRHLVRPGITGWAQVNGRNNVPWEDRFKLDVWYVENQSLLLDVKILFLTLKKVLKKEGISFEGHATMYFFTGTEAQEESKLKILETEEEWMEVLAKFPLIDIFYSPKYTHLFAEIEKGKARTAFYENQSTKILYPFILREIPSIDKNYKDIVTPYGYGGPYIEGDTQEVESFYSLFANYCRKNHIVTETVRLHPLYKNEEYMKNVINTRFLMNTATVDLQKPYDEIWNSYSKNNQRNIKKAQKIGLSVEVVPKNAENITVFQQLYEMTMNRNNAHAHYYFNRDFFTELLEEDPLYESYLLFGYYQKQVIAAVILLIGKEFAHYQFGASHTDYLHLRPNNLLFDSMIKFSREKGAKLLHLGGGYRGDDGLFKFKSSFSNIPYYSYYLGTNIYNNEIFNELGEMASKHGSYNPNFFPPYRSVL